MLKNVAGVWCEGKPSEDEWTVRTYDLGNGHREAVITRPVVWAEVEPEQAAYLGEDWAELQAKQREEDAEEREQANRLRSARRAKTRVRRLVKVMGLDALLTLTYRANQTDLKLCKEHFAAFARRTRKLLPGFRYVAAFEQQKRGAWHVHIAVHALPRELPWAGVKVKSYSVIRAIWRNVVGDLAGNIDQQRRKRNSKQSSSKLAAYLSKYMLKAFEEGDDWSNRYSASSCDVPRPVMLRFRSEALRDLVDLVFQDIVIGDAEVTMWMSRFGDVFYLSAEGALSP